MDFMLMPLRRYADFSGRSRRKEYWMFALFMFVGAILLSIVESIIGVSGMIGGAYGPLTALFFLAMIVPGIAVGVRRLHDTDRSGWWMLIAFVPIIGSFILLYFYVLDGTPGTNDFGPNPKIADHRHVFA